MANIVIDVAAEFTGKKAFDQASKSTFNLEKSVKKLAGAFGLAFSTQRIVAFGKASVKAFAEDNAAIIVLRKNLQNLGLAYESTNAENFIASLEAQSAILDDKLRPAYAQLSKVTLSAIKTQELMTLAVDVSRSTGVDFTTVINTLSRAYIGNYKGLKQLNIGLSDAELKTKDFAEIQAILIKQSQGAGKAYIETFAGSIDKLAVASANAKEVIGEGLVDLFADLAGNGDINKATDNIDELSTAVGTLLKDLDKFTPLDFLATFVTGSITKETFDKLNLKPGGGFTDSQNAARLDAQKKAKADAKAAAAKLAADKKNAKAAAAAKIAADKKAAANKAILAKAESIFDLEKIQIEAALKGKISADEKLRLELQRAILNEDFELADKLQKRLEASQRATAALQGTLAAIKPVPSPFDEWIKALKEIGETLSKILGINVNTSSSMLNPNQPIVATQTPNSPFQEGTIPIPVTTVSDLADAATAAADMATLAANEAAAIAADAAAFASSLAAGAAASVAMIPGNNPHPILPYTGSSSSIFNPYGLSSNIAGWGTNISTVQDTPAMPPIVVNIEGLIDMDNVEGVFNMAMLNAIRKGLPQTIAGALP